MTPADPGSENGSDQENESDGNLQANYSSFRFNLKAAYRTSSTSWSYCSTSSHPSFSINQHVNSGDLQTFLSGRTSAVQRDGTSVNGNDKAELYDLRSFKYDHNGNNNIFDGFNFTTYYYYFEAWVYYYPSYMSCGVIKGTTWDNSTATASVTSNYLAGSAVHTSKPGANQDMNGDYIFTFRKEYKIYYRANRTDSTNVATVTSYAGLTYATEKNLNATPPTGYIHTGWETTTSGWLKTNSAKLTVDSDIVIMPVFTKTGIYKITLDDNGGSGGKGKIYEWYGVGFYSDEDCTNAITSVTKPTRSWYSFAGYCDSSSSTANTRISSAGKITASNTFTSQDKTIYANWTKSYYTVTLDKGGGNGGTSEIYYWNGSWYSNTACTSSITSIPTRPEKKWYKFDGYYSSSTSTTQYADANGKITRSSVSGNETWYAHWSKDASQALTITLTDHGGSGGKGKIYFWNTSYYSDAACSSVITTVTKPSKTGYTFAGYYSKSEDGTQNVDGTGKITKTSVSVNEEWHAHWDADYNHIYITIKSKGFTDATFSASATGGSVTVTGYTDSNGTAIESTSQVTTASGDVQCMVGYSVTVSPAAKSGYTLVYLGTDANWDTSKTLSTSNWTDANTSKGNKNVYAYFIQEPGNKVKYDSAKKYYYFENGEFPQAYVGDDTNKTLQSASLGTANYTISTAWGNIPVYTYNSHRYAMLTATSAQTIKTSKGTLTTAKDGKYFFEVQPIRWIVKSSDWTADYAYNSNFVGVTADILLFSSVNTSNLNYDKDFSTTTLQSTLNGIIQNANLNNFAASVSYKTEYFNGSSTKLVKESATLATGTMRVVSKSDLEAVGSWQATASDLALFMYSSKMGANSDTAGNMAYWTRNLGTYLNNGTIVTATGNTKNNHLTEFNGVRFAITFTSGGRFGI